MDSQSTMVSAVVYLTPALLLSVALCDSEMTCGQVKEAYKGGSCCGEPDKMLAIGSRGRSGGFGEDVPCGQVKEAYKKGGCCGHPDKMVVINSSSGGGEDQPASVTVSETVHAGMACSDQDSHLSQAIADTMGACIRVCMDIPGCTAVNFKKTGSNQTCLLFSGNCTAVNDLDSDLWRNAHPKYKTWRRSGTPKRAGARRLNAVGGFMCSNWRKIQILAGSPSFAVATYYRRLIKQEYPTLANQIGTAFHTMSADRCGLLCHMSGPSCKGMQYQGDDSTEGIGKGSCILLNSSCTDFVASKAYSHYKMVEPDDQNVWTQPQTNVALVPCEKSQAGWFWCKIMVPALQDILLPQGAAYAQEACQEMGADAVGACQAVGLGPEDPFSDICSMAVQFTVTRACEWAIKKVGQYLASEFTKNMGCGGYTVPMVSQISAAWRGKPDEIPPMVIAGQAGMMWYNQEGWYVLHDLTWYAGVIFQDVSWPANTKSPPNVTVGLSNGQVWLFNYSSSTQMAGNLLLNLSNLTTNWVQLGTNPFSNAVSGMSVDWQDVTQGSNPTPLVAIGMNTSTLEYLDVTDMSWQSSSANMNGWGDKTWTSVFDAKWVFEECGDQPTIVYGSETGYAGMYTCTPDESSGCSCVQSFQTKPMGHVENKRIIATQLSVEWSLFSQGTCPAPSAVWTFGESDVWMYNGCTNNGDMVQVAPQGLKDDKGITQLAVNWEPCLSSGDLLAGSNNCIEIIMGFLTSAVWWLPPYQGDLTSEKDWTMLRSGYKNQAVSQMSVNFQTGCSQPSLVMALENGQLIIYNSCQYGGAGGWHWQNDAQDACLSRMNVFNNNATQNPSGVVTTDSGYAMYINGVTRSGVEVHVTTTSTTPAA